MFLEREPQISSIGKLIIIGGSENKRQGEVLKTVVNSTPLEGNLGVAPLATDDRDGYMNDYLRAFPKFGFSSERVIALMESADFVDYLRDTQNTSILLPGGAQDRLVRILGDEGMRSLRDLYSNGGTIAGTSAGACMGEYMIVGKNNGKFDIEPGLGLTKKIIVDTHFRQRDRQYRLIQAVDAVAGWSLDGFSPVGVGLDEDTGVVVTDDRFAQVIGSGRVTIYDHGVNAYELQSGDKFDLVERRII